MVTKLADPAVDDLAGDPAYRRARALKFMAGWFGDMITIFP